MEEPLKIQQSSSVGKSKLRYPLRSASKLKDQTNKSPEVASYSSKRGRTSSMSKSVSVLELPGKEKEKAAGKPPRRLSIPAKSVSPRPRAANTTPISRSLANRQERCDTPLSDVSRSSTRRKFNILSSESYWLSQIKLSESAAKHSISLGFFKLALEAGCEPMQRLREELKSYAQRHNLAELGEAGRGLFETFEQLRESVISREDVQSTCSTAAATKKLKPKSLNTENQAPSKKENVQKTRTKPTSVSQSGANNNIKKKVEKSNSVEKINEDEKPVSEQANALDMEETLEGNKENMGSVTEC